MRHKTAGLENLRLDNVAQNAGRENAGKENMAQEILGWKMRDKSVWKANRRFYVTTWIVVYWQNKNNHVVHIFRTV